MKNFGLFIWVILTLEASAWGGSGDKILLKDVQTLTLRVGQFTNGRRSAGVPQIKCTGGTAGCDAFVPQVVQCYNRGWDGADFQWECKADMDNAYRFGSIAVTCEGYDYPDDPYVLRGSCGLEYVLDLTKEGYQTKTQERYSSGQTYDNIKQKGGFSLETLTLFAGVGILVYAVYKTCIAPTDRTDQRSTTNDDYPGRPDPSTGRSNPPPPGFRSDYYPSAPGGDSCSGGATRGGGASSGASSGAGGFWTGAATGGLLGYMFGNRNTGYNAYNTGYGGNRGAGWSFDNWGSRTGGSQGFGGSMASTSSGTRSASGFGGTRRR